MPGWLKRGRTNKDEPEKPFFSGKLHLAGFYFFAFIGLLVVALSKDHAKKMSFFVYVMSTLCLYAASTTLHTTKWHDPKLELWIQKLDHAMIIIQIAGTYTPVCLVNMPDNETWPLLILGSVWLLSALGMFKSLYWNNPPKIFNVAYYFLLGLTILPFMPKVVKVLDKFEWISFAVAGIIYLCGGATYGLEWPDPHPKIFGFHEIFHLCTLTANILFFVPIGRAALLQSFETNNGPRKVFGTTG